MIQTSSFWPQMTSLYSMFLSVQNFSVCSFSVQAFVINFPFYKTIHRKRPNGFIADFVEALYIPDVAS